MKTSELQPKTRKKVSKAHPRRAIVVFGGGFQPWSPWHTRSYLAAKHAFPDAQMYIASSNNTRERPLPYKEKSFLIKQAGVTDPVVQVKKPFDPTEITSNYDSNTDVLVLVRSAKDPVPYTKKDGSPAYYQPITSLTSLDQAQPFSKHGYVFVPPIEEVSILGKKVNSATTIRNWYKTLDKVGRIKLIKAMYPSATNVAGIKQIFDDYFDADQPATGISESKLTTIRRYTIDEDEATQFNMPQSSLGAMPGLNWSGRDEYLKRVQYHKREEPRLRKFMGKPESLDEADPPNLSSVGASSTLSYVNSDPTPVKKVSSKQRKREQKSLENFLGHTLGESASSKAAATIVSCLLAGTGLSGCASLQNMKSPQQTVNTVKTARSIALALGTLTGRKIANDLARETRNYVDAKNGDLTAQGLSTLYQIELQNSRNRTDDRNNLDSRYDSRYDRSGNYGRTDGVGKVDEGDTTGFDGDIGTSGPLTLANRALVNRRNALRAFEKEMEKASIEDFCGHKK